MNDGPSWEDPRSVLRRHGMAPRRSLSQNFLISRGATDDIAKAAVVREGEPVVELGAGVGTLTAALLREGASVVAVERDRRMVDILRQELAELPAVRVVAADAASVDFGAFVPAGLDRICVVGNLPFAVTGAIMKHLIWSNERLARAVLTVQREVGERLQAVPGSSEYGALTVFTSAVFSVSTLFRLPASSFYPRPKVDSLVIRLDPLDAPRAKETGLFRNLVRSAFQGRRKTLRNALLQSREIEAECIDAALRRTGIDGRRRGETLSVEEFAQLAEACEPESPDIGS
jgi:16S rRNA (adenine1518-N6/adenine1519-N6)-dimethyltransferase